jgi:hypothetical protein
MMDEVIGISTSYLAVEVGIVFHRELIAGLFIGLSGVASATPLARVLDVSVDIVVDRASAELEIVAPKTDFLAVYRAENQRFNVLDIPFRVRSVDSFTQNYTLSLAQLFGACRALNEPVTALSLTTLLDDVPFEPATPSSLYTAAPEREHLLAVTFPQIAQTPASQSCEGSVGVIAAVVI